MVSNSGMCHPTMGLVLYGTVVPLLSCGTPESLRYATVQVSAAGGWSRVAPTGGMFWVGGGGCPSAGVAAGLPEHM